MVVACGVEWWWASAVALAIVLWRYGMARATRSQLAGLVVVLALGGAVVIIVAAGPSLPLPHGVVVDWYGSLPYQALAGVSFTTFALVIGAVLFLIETSNVIVRLALRAESEVPVAAADKSIADSESLTEAAQRSIFSIGKKKMVVVPPPDDDIVKLKGGRYIGPIERLFLLALILAGQFGVMAAVVAAKGIIRFPEISKDAEGSKAEYFLVGSFTSWALVGTLSLLIWLGR
ncbi:hypothetical protein SAMN06295879_2306 [Agreia bicolorata]|uniref:Uncharacterized protein n=1 Tax=Agreia bicolorata TaxID=110935 RepID=A0A1T4Y616_9MICO|nr:hypothetical protein [Agreia bicolorata]SKA97284.1 hypothetical protein SAMN06295879_2306 [Agreia bicolorata]